MRFQKVFFPAPGPSLPDLEQFRATVAATQTLSTASTIEQVVFGTEVADTAGGFASNAFTVPVSLNGEYMTFVAAVQTQSDERHEVIIERSTDSGSTFPEIARNGVNIGANVIATTGPMLLTTGHIYRVRYEFTSGINAVIADDDNTFFAGYLTT